MSMSGGPPMPERVPRQPALVPASAPAPISLGVAIVHCRALCEADLSSKGCASACAQHLLVKCETRMLSELVNLHQPGLCTCMHTQCFFVSLSPRIACSGAAHLSLRTLSSVQSPRSLL